MAVRKRVTTEQLEACKAYADKRTETLVDRGTLPDHPTMPSNPYDAGDPLNELSTSRKTPGNRPSKPATGRMASRTDRETSGSDTGHMGPILDITTMDATVKITSPRGERAERTFRIKTQPDDATFMPGERIVSLLVKWGKYPDREQSFGFAHDEGISVWSRYRSGDPKHPSPQEWFADMLERPSHYKEKGYEYIVKVDRIIK